MRNEAFAALSLAAAVSAATVHAGTIEARFPAPAIDRWMYPFNSSPGARPVISTFGSTPGATDFDSRDAQMLVRFDTAPQVPVGQGAQLTVLRATLLLEVANDLVFAYDPTSDPWQTFLAPSDPQWQADADPGQPVECFGVGFRNGWTLQSFAENSPFAPSGANVMLPGVRNAFAAAFDAGGTLVDVSQNPRQRFEARRFAVGTVAGLAPGSLVPIGSTMRFELDVSDPAIQGYLRSGLNEGRLMLAVSSLTFVQQQAGQFPTFIAKENVYVQLGLSLPARLELDVSDAPPCAPEDFDCSGQIDGSDLSALLGAWGTAEHDLDGNGTTDGGDLSRLLGAWG